MTEVPPDYAMDSDEDVKGGRIGNNSGAGYVGASISGWNELMLKDEVKRALKDAGFEHPSEVQVGALPFTIEGHDVLCQAKSGMGKTAVFVISVLNQLKTNENGEYDRQSTIVTCHTRELTHQILKDFKRLGKYFKGLRIGCYFGGNSVDEQIDELKNKNKEPHIIIATPGRLFDLLKHQAIKPDKCKHFIVDECDQVIGNPKMRSDIQEVFLKTKQKKQVMMFSATMPDEIKKDCKKFMKNEVEIFIDDSKLILHGLVQYYCTLPESKKFQKLTHLLDNLAFNQIIIFVNRVDRAIKLADLLTNKMFNPICIHSKLSQDERIKNYDNFKNNSSRLLVSTDLFGRGMDIERVNLVINFDFPHSKDAYLHRVGRAGRFGTKGLTISFVRTEDQEVIGGKQGQAKTDKEVLMEIQDGFKIKIGELPAQIDTNLYM